MNLSRELLFFVVLSCSSRGLINLRTGFDREKETFFTPHGSVIDFSAFIRRFYEPFFFVPRMKYRFMFFFSLTVPTRVLYFGFFAALVFVVASAAASNRIERFSNEEIRGMRYLHYDNETASKQRC
jgi:hypothetical protein